MHIKSMQRSMERKPQNVIRPSIQQYIDYLSVEGTVDAPFGGAMWQEELDRKHETYAIQKAYKTRRKEMDDTMHYLLPRETLAERRERIEALMR